MIGQLLARRYQIIRVLGAGAFGQTYVAQDTHIPGNPTCVVKHLKPASNFPKFLETARQLFQREAETLVKLGKHDQIPHLLAYFEEDQEFYLVQEFIEGHILTSELLPGQRLPESQVIQLLEEVLNILVFVHSQGVIHRDIKPDNIIRRSNDNKLVLIDFGAIKQVQNQQLPSTVEQEQEQSVASSTRIGTPGYTPTEQDRGKPRPCSDIYALGMIGIQALTGVFPQQLQEDDESGEIIWQHQAQVSSELEAILTKMVRYHFKDRYQSATEALLALQLLKNSPPTPSVQATVVDRITHDVHELILEWVEGGMRKTQPIRSNQRSKNPGTVRIGRDPTACDIVLSQPTVSGQHVEIFFNPQEKRFYLRSLRENNPPIVDGQSLPTGEVVLHRASKLQLGQLVLRVAAIEHQSLSTDSDYTPTMRVARPVSASPQPVPPTPDTPDVQTASQNTTSSSSRNQTRQPVNVKTNFSSTSDSSLLPLLIKLGVAALIAVGGGYAYLQWQSNNSKPTDKSITNSEPSALSNSTDKSIADSEPSALSNSTDKSIADSEPSALSNSTDKSIADSEPSALSNSTDKSIADSEPTAKPRPTDRATANSDSTANSEPKGTSKTNSDSTQPPRDNGSITLAKATDKAKRGDSQGAIELAEQIPSSSSAYEPAQNAIAQWQEQQQQKLAKEQAEEQARRLLDNAREVAQKGGDGDIETAIDIAKEAIAQAPPDSAVYKEAQKAIAQWQGEATAKPKQDTAASSYKCYCQPSAPDAQKAVTSTDSPTDLTGSSCTASGEPEAKVTGVWKCEKK